MPLLEQVVEVIQAHRLLPRRGRAVIAVSGGLDSMVLLHLLHRLAADYDWALTVAHLDHRLRGRTSRADARWVQRAAEGLFLPFVTETADVKRLAAREGISLEMAGRRVRHAFLAQTALAAKARRVVLAHHAQDQVELFFLRLLRGAGTGGLSGMQRSAPSPADRRVTLIRPLLNIPRTDLEAYARQHRVRFREDASNQQLDILRNRIRHVLLPLLQDDFQPALIPVLLRQMEILGAEEAHLAESLQQWVARGVNTPFAQWPVTLQRRHLQAELQRLGVPVEFSLVESLRQEADRPVMVSPQRCVTRTTSGSLCVSPPRTPDFNPAELIVDLRRRSGTIHFQGWRLEWKRTALRRRTLPGRVENREWFDAAKVGSVITLRFWRNGDRFQPIGLERATKLQDLFTNLKVPATERRQRLLACNGAGEIWWVQGLRIGEPFKIDPRTRQALEWRWTKT